ncbi:MAG TPA: hypothetical protein VFJ02_06965, partial [Vicinamibacterales bacterium]|nr:hypothetical protein [Vicinamibacterales bacterium]
MWRILRAFAWMRWRVLMNALERTGARDTMERLSLAVEQIGPLIALGLLVPSAVALAGLGGYAGYTLAGHSPVITFEAIRLLLGVASAFCLIGPLVMPSLERTSAVRLLLLPISRRILYVAQAAGALSDPWIFLAIAPLAGIAVGLAAAGAVTAAAVALVGGLLLLLLLIGLSALATFALQLLVRDRRRGELIALLFIIVVPTFALLPLLSRSQMSREEVRAARAARAERQARGEETGSERAMRIAGRAYMLLPSEMYARATRASAHGDPARAALPLAGIALAGLALHAMGFVVFGKLLEAPGSASRRQAGGSDRAAALHIPGVGRASAAVAQAQVRLATRTPRGRSILLSPMLIFLVLTFIMSRSSGRVELGAIDLDGGLGLALFGVTFCLITILPLAMNQFAVDRAGLTLAFLSPVSTGELLLGKALGNAAIAGGPGLTCVAIAFAIFHDGRLAFWLS